MAAPMSMKANQTGKGGGPNLVAYPYVHSFGSKSFSFLCPSTRSLPNILHHMVSIVCNTISITKCCIILFLTQFVAFFSYRLSKPTKQTIPLCVSLFFTMRHKSSHLRALPPTRRCRTGLHCRPFGRPHRHQSSPGRRYGPQYPS